jgi:mannitol-1-/sugar-/sorbitol-6-phosphatase
VCSVYPGVRARTAGRASVVGVIDFRASGVLFDMDGTLVDSTAIVEGAWGRFGATHGIDPQEILAFSHGRQTIDTVTRFLPHLSDSERTEIAHALVADEVENTHGIVEIPGAAAFLEQLVDAGVPVALVTSAPRDLAVNRMRAAGVRVPDVIVTAEDVPHGKPAPDCYLRGAELLGLVAGDCAAFEDAPAGIESAVRSGAHTVVVGGVQVPVADGLDRIAGYAELRVSRIGDRFRITG